VALGDEGRLRRSGWSGGAVDSAQWDGQLSSATGGDDGTAWAGGCVGQELTFHPRNELRIELQQSGDDTKKEDTKKMDFKIFDDRDSMGEAAAAQAAAAIRRAILDRGKARIVAATAASQKEFLDALTRAPGIDWRLVEAFHLDEYIGLPATHPGSFRKMLLDQLIAKAGIVNYHLLGGDGDPAEVVRSVSAAVASAPIDIAFLGIGENGHLAFNDPPADFETEEPYLIVTLDEACRQQQVGEAWFAKVADVPQKAISMSVRQILKARELLAVAPGPQKAQAISACFNGEISPMAPASILRTHPNTTVYLDKESAALLDPDLHSLAETRNR
jgi:glucosamine-6-phosphate deaminase